VIDAGSGKNRHYLYSQGGALAYLWDQGTGERTQYIQLAGSLVAARKVAGSGAVSVRYQHTDALGSPVAETNEQAAVWQWVLEHWQRVLMQPRIFLRVQVVRKKC
jgi:hypothetical protein